MKRPEIIIIGAGLTGLSLGYFLKNSGKNIMILEKGAKPGGVINTLSENGFVYEKGPNTGVLSTPELAMLFEELKGRCMLEIANPSAKKRYILKNSVWEPLPSGPVSAINTPLFSFKDKLRILGEPFRRKGTDPDESVADLVVRRLGRSYLDYAVNPFISGVYAGDPEKLITRYALPKLYALEQNYGSFIGGSLAKGRIKKTETELKATREVFSVRGGLSNLIKSLCDEIGYENIQTGCRKVSIIPDTEGYKVNIETSSSDIKIIHAPKVVTTSGAYALPSLLPFLQPEELVNITELQYAGVVQVSAGYSSWTGSKLDAFGGLVPAKEKRKILGILFPSAIFKGRAPENGALLSVFMGGINNMEALEKDDSEITDIVLNEIGKTLNNKTKPDLIKIHRYLHAIPQYGRSTGARLETISSIEKKYPGLILAGNIRDGIGMADRVKQAFAISRLLVKNR
ncbi:MAG TPA: protoporphyrinogen oxidase [Bacteroidales bacterium]|nr:protoporphyrinogen oxidase [Bacteroidales bacterium]